MWLKEESTGLYYPAYDEKGNAQKYTFTMEKKHKAFQWIYDRTGESRRIYRWQHRKKKKHSMFPWFEKNTKHLQRSIDRHTNEEDPLGMPPKW
jgi:hypothetical protein